MPELGIGLGIHKGGVPKKSLLLDKYDMDAAFSLRKVRADYNGPCVRVRNSSGEFADIGFTSKGVLDEAALNAHCGENDGTVQTWYNQSTEGGRYNAVQDTVADQPIIYDASAGGYLGYVENTGDMYLRFENQLAGATNIAVVYEKAGGLATPASGSAYVLGEHSASSSGKGVTVDHSATFPGFTIFPASGNGVISHTGAGAGVKHSGFVYFGGDDDFLVVDGYVCAEATSVVTAPSLDYIFTKANSGGSQDSFDFIGKVWEVFLSTSDLSDKRIALENSILSANGLTVPEQTLLEKYDGAAAAYSLRCVNRSHVGPIVEVRGNSTEDVYLDSSGVVNEARITALCTGVDGFVRTWYDQAGSNDATQTTDANQPKIHDATDGVVLENGRPAIGNWISEATILIANFGTTYNDVHVFSVSKENGGGSVGYIVSGDTSTDFRLARNGQSADVWLYDGAISKTTTAESYVQAVVSATNETSPTVYFNGALRTMDNTLNGNGMSGAYIGNHPTLSGLGNVDGTLQEIVIYDSDQSSNREGIESNINAHYLIYQEATASPASGFLADYSGAAAAYSVRQLGDANLCMRVRRDGDDAEKNIGFASDGFVDTTAISDFCGSNDGFVVTWFDQSGSAVDATQTTPANQPKIYDGTDGITKENGIPTIQFDGTDDYLEVDGYIVELSQNSASVFSVANAGTPSSSGDYLLSEGDATSPYSSNFIFGGAGTGGSGVVLWVNGTEFGTITEGQHITGFDYDGTNFQAYLDGSTSGSSGTATVNSETVGGGTYIGSRADGTTSFYEGNAQEIITYKSDKSSDRSDIESNINDAFDIYPSTETPTSGFLGEFSGAAAAYSVRKLGDSPVAMRVRKTVSAVDYYQVIGFDANGDLDTAAIEEFADGNDVFVQTWYDQSGNGRHQVQSVNLEQPKVYDGTNGLYYAEGNVAIWFNDQGMVDSSNNQITVLDQSIFVVAERSSTVDADRGVFVGHTEDATYQVFAAQVWGGSDANTADRLIFYAGTDFDSAEIPVSIDTKQNLMTYGWHHDDNSIFQYNGEEPALNADGDPSPTQSTYQISVGSNNYNPLEAYVTEVIVYEGMRDATTRVNIEKNQNNYFLVHQEASASPATGLLSEAPNAAAAYSVRQLGDAKLCMKVRRGSDNAEKNIGFVGGVVDTAAIEAFCGNSDGTVAVWYDQSGSGNHATQGSAGSQPKIYDNATGVELENGNPILSFGVNNRFNLSSNLSILNENFFYVTAETVDLTVYSLVDNTDYLRNQLTRYLLNDGGTFYQSSISPSSGYSVHSVINNDGAYQNGTKLADFTNTLTISADSILEAHSAGSYQELVIYDSDQSDNREDIETNINNHFKIYTPFTTGLLDSYPGAAAAYSLRRLSSTYTGPAIEVTSNSSTQDIGFDIEGNLDTSALAAFCGSNDGTVSKWYDQSGNGNDAAQTTLASQPKIYDGTDGVVLENGKPAAEFDSSAYLSSTTVTNTGEATAYVVANGDDTALNKVIFFVPEVFAYLTNAEILTLYSGITPENPGGSTTSIETNDTLVNNLIFFGNDGSTTFGGVNGQAFVTQANVPNSDSGYDKIKIGANATNTINFDGTIQEAVYYNSDQRSVRSGIENNINKHYSIYDQPLLDVVPDAAAAYSLRKLRADYTGPAINVYNGTDYKDIYFRRDGSLDTAAIAKFCGSNDGTVAIWYDQSGNNRNAEQTTVASQPKIYDGTDGLLTENGNPIVTDNDATTAHLSASVSTSTGNYVFGVVRGDNDYFNFLNGDSDQKFLFVGQDGVTSTSLGGVSNLTTFVNGESTSLTTRDSVHDEFRDTQSLITAEFDMTSSIITLGYSFSASVSIMATQELIIYSSDQSSNRTVAEANINHYYGIY